MKKKLFFFLCLFTLLICCFGISCFAGTYGGSGITSVTVNDSAYCVAGSGDFVIKINTDASCWKNGWGAYVNYYMGVIIKDPNGKIVFDNREDNKWAYGKDEASRYQTFTIQKSELSGSLPEGTYSIYPYDYEYNWYSADKCVTYEDKYYTFRLDYTNPVITLLDENGNAISSGSYTNQNITINISESASSALSFVSVNNNPTSQTGVQDRTFSEEGRYSLYAVDLAGNVSDFISFVIDKTPPAVTVYGDVKQNGSFSSQLAQVTGGKQVKPHNIVGMKFLRFTVPENCTATRIDVDTEEQYQSGEIVSNTGLYKITDLAGNQTFVRITNDNIAPTISATTDTGLQFNTSITPVKSTSIQITVNDTTNTLKSVVVKYRTTKDDSYTTIENTSSSLRRWSATYNDEGYYEITARDAAGNQSTMTFVVDRTVPTATLKKGSSVATTEDDGKYYFKATDKLTFTATDLHAVTLYLDDVQKSSISNISIADLSEGTHTVKATDAAGNTVTISFVVDKTAPTGTLSGVENGGATNGDVTFSWAEDGCSATLDGTTYAKDAKIPHEENTEKAYTLILTDRAGNSTTYTFTIDRVCPTYTVNAKDHVLSYGAITNANVWISWDKKENYTGTIQYNDGEPVLYLQSFYYQDGVLEKKYATEDEALEQIELFVRSKITQHTWDGTDLLEDSYFYSDADRSAKAPNAIYWKYENEGTCVIFFVEDNKEAFISKTTGSLCKSSNENILSLEGTYTFKLVDAVGNETTRIFTIDKTAPTGTLSGVTNGGVTKSNVSFTWKEEGCTATHNGKTYTSGTAIKAEGTHTIVLTDRAGNETKLSFEIDKTAPTAKLKKGSSVATTADDEKYYFNEEDTLTFTANDLCVYCNEEKEEKLHTVSLHLDDILQTSISNISIADLSEGEHTITATDVAGNTVTISFVVDKTAPTGTLSGVENGGATKGDVTFTWAEDGCTVIEGGISTITPEKSENFWLCTWLADDENQDTTYTIYLTDRAGNSTSYKFTIDKTAPTGTLSGVADGGRTNDTVKCTWSETGVVATLKKDGGAANTYSSGTQISEEGNYELTLTDTVGNMQTYTFEIDLTKPAGVLTGVTDGGVTNGIVSFAWSEASATATLNGKNYNSGTSVSEAGNYRIVLTDSVGNSTTYVFEIDKTAPVGTLSGVENGGITNGTVSFGSWSEEGCTATLNGNPYAANTLIGQENIHTIILTDKAGNSTEYKFEIDRTAPTLIMSNVANGGITNQSVSVSWNEASAFVVDGENNAVLSGTTYSLPGKYSITITDEAKNSKTYTFTIDKTAPVGTLSGVTDGGVTKSNVSFAWKEEGCVATLNGNGYSSNTQISKEGIYTLVLTDLAGNSTTYTFEIDKTAPEASFTCDPSKTDNGKHYFNQNVAVLWTEEGCVATLNGNSYSSNTQISEEGTYELVLTDLAGNKTTFSIVIDTTPYTKNYDYVKEIGKNHASKWYQTYFYTLDGTRYIKGGYYSFSNYDNALTYSVERELSIVETTQPYTGGAIICSWAGKQVDGFDVASSSEMIGNQAYIYWDIADSSKLIAYFNYNNMLQAVNYYAEQSIAETYLPKTPAPAFPGSDTVPAQEIARPYYYTKNVFSFPNNPSDVTLYVNGSVVNYDETSFTEGLYSIREIDFAGNEISYSIFVDNTAPKAIIRDAAGNRISNYEKQFETTEKIYFCREFSLELDDIDAQALLVVSFGGNTTHVVGETFTFAKSGIYNVTFYDVAGNSASYTIYLSLEQFTVTATEKVSIKGTTTTVLGTTIEISSSLSFNSINSITIIRGELGSNLETDEYIIVSEDANGKTINADVLTYYFATTGSYKVEILDNFGRTTVKEFDLYKDAPVGKLFSADGIQINSKTSTRKNVYFTWEDDSCTATINGLEYTLKSYIIEEGTYEIVLTDTAGNRSFYFFTIDRTEPTGTLSGVTNGGKTNTDVSFAWDDVTEATTVAYIKKGANEYAPYDKGTVITTDGSYSIKLVDAAGNEKLYSFHRDSTPPEITLQTVSGKILTNGSLTNQTVYFMWKDSGCTATLNGADYSSKQSILTSGTYTFHIEDSFGNFTIMTVVVDKDAPTGTLNGVVDSGKTNTSVSFTWNEAAAIASLKKDAADVIPYTSDTEISEEGVYILVLTDRAGNSTTYTFEIDKTAPEGTLSGVTEGGVTKSNVSFSWNEGSATATLDGETYSKKEYITSEGFHTIVLTDSVGNASVYTFEIDKTAPTGSFVGTYIQNGTIYYFNSVLSFTWAEEGCVATLNGNSYTSGTQISEEGNYELILTDRAGNSAAFFAVIDKTAPEGSFSTQGAFVDNIYLFNSSVYMTWSESGVSASLDGDGYEKRTILSVNGEYTLVLTDLAGNSTTYTFVIDQIQPEGDFTGNYNKVGTTFYFKTAFAFTWDEAGSIATLNGLAYEKGTQITAEGAYTIVLSDLAGNNVTYNAILDKTAPSLVPSITGTVVSEHSYFKNNVSFTWSENGATATLNGNPYAKKTVISAEGTYTLVVTDRAENETTLTFTIDKTAPTAIFSEDYKTNFSIMYFIKDIGISWKESGLVALLNDSPIQRNATIIAEGSYTLVLTDRAGNYTEYYLVYDKTAPTGTLSGVTDGGVTNNSVSMSWSESGATATLNGSTYKKGSSITAADSYTLVLTDLAGNSMTYTFTIDKTAPTGTLSGVTEGGVTKSNVYFTWNDANCVTTINGNSYTSGTQISEEGVYTLVLTDRAGNSTTYTFEIDKTAPAGALTGVSDGEKTNTNVSFTWSENGATATLNGEPYSKRQYITENGTYELVLTDRAGNSTTYTFTIDKDVPTGSLLGVTNGGVTNSIVSFVWAKEGCVATLNGNSYSSGTDVTAEGIYVLVLTDVIGNSSTYTFTIDKTAPIGTLSGVTEGGVTKSNVSFTWSENGATATLNGNPYSNKTYITTDGIYELVLVDRSGNSTTYTFTIDKTVPTGTLSGVTNGGRTNGEVLFSWADNTVIATLNGQPFENGSAILDEGKYTLLLTDRAGNSTTYTFTIDRSVTAGLLYGVANKGITNTNVYFTWSDSDCTATLNGNPYKQNSMIAAEGSYKILLTDSVCNTIEYTFTIDKTAPKGIYNKTADKEVEDTSYFRSDVSFTWSEMNITATLNEKEYIANTTIGEGSHTIILTDRAGNTTTYSFVIDKTAPIGSLSGVRNGGITNTPVRFSWQGGSCTATLNGGDLQNESTISVEGYYTIILSDVAGNISIYRFEIDKTAPEGTLSGVTNGGTVNANVSFSWDQEKESTAIATLKKGSAEATAYSPNTEISEEGAYELVLTDKAGNSSTYTFEIDRTAPTGSFVNEGVSLDGNLFFSESTKFTWEEKTVTATLDGEKYSNNSFISKAGAHTLVLTDRAGNSTTYTFEIIKEVPTANIILPTTDENGENQIVQAEPGRNYTYAESVSIAPADGCTVKVNGVEITEATLLQPGTHEIVMLNKANVEKKITITIKDPIVEDTDEGLGTADIVLIVLASVMGIALVVTIIRNIFHSKRKIGTRRIR